MSADLASYSARCWNAKLTVRKDSAGNWTMSLHRYSGKARNYRSIVFVSGRGDTPRIDLEQDADPMLWLSGACIDFPTLILPGLKAFLAEHAPANSQPAAAGGDA